MQQVESLQKELASRTQDLERMLLQYSSAQFELSQTKQSLMVADGDRKLLQARINEMEASQQSNFATHLQLQQMNAALQAKLSLSVD